MGAVSFSMISAILATIILALAMLLSWSLSERRKTQRFKRELYQFFVDNPDRRFTIGELSEEFSEHREQLFYAMYQLMTANYITDNIRSIDPLDSRNEEPRDQIDALLLPNKHHPKNLSKLFDLLYEYGLK